MLQALLRGKLSPEQENMEDILTSGVFGLLEYIPPENGLVPFLRLAQFCDGINAGADFLTPDLKILEIEFWRTFVNESVGSTEPDVVIRARDGNGHSHIILIEVKLWSSKSSRPNPREPYVTDQLAREWCVLVGLCREANASPHLYYLTADRHYPHGEIKESANEYSQKRPVLAGAFPFRCAWLSWLQIAEEFRESTEPVLRDISRACLKLDLTPFQGFSRSSPTKLAWDFAEGAEPFMFATQLYPIEWSYE
jgi:hypothetical protein